MAMRLSLVVDGDASGAKKAAEDTKRVIGEVGKSAEAASKTAAAATERTQASIAGIGAGSARAVQQAAIAQGAVGKTAQLSTQQLSQMQFQLQDLGVQIASGQSPFMALLQQGSQVVQMFGPGVGVGAALRSVGAGFTSFVTNPLNLALIGFSSLAGLAVTAFGSIVGGVEDSSAALERHEKLIEDIKAAYGDAAHALDDYARDSRVALAARAADEQKATLDSLKPKAAELLGQFPRFRRDEELEPFKQAFLDLIESARNGTPQLVRFYDTVSAIGVANAEARPKVTAMSVEILNAAEAGRDAEKKLSGMRLAVGRLGDEIAAWTPQLAAYRDALSSLQGIALPDLSDREQALADYQKAIGAAGGFEERRAAAVNYDAAIGRVNVSEKKAADEQAAREAASAARSAARSAGRSAISEGKREDREADRERDAVQGVISSLRDEYDALGLSNRERAIRNQLQAAGIGATPTDLALIRDEAGALYDLKEAQSEANKSMQLARGAVDGVVNSYRQARESGKDFIDSVLAGLDTLENRLLDLIQKQLLDQIFQTGGGAGGGGGFLSFVGSLFGGGGSAPAAAGGIPWDWGSFHAATGGYIAGPGTGTSDSIPARLSNGEFVINARSTAEHRPLLEAINSRGFAAGGYVGAPPPRSWSQQGATGGGPPQVIVKPEIVIPPGHQARTENVPDGQGGTNPRVVIEKSTASALGGARGRNAMRRSYGLAPQLPDY